MLLLCIPVEHEVPSLETSNISL